MNMINESETYLEACEIVFTPNLCWNFDRVWQWNSRDPVESLDKANEMYVINKWNFMRFELREGLEYFDIPLN